MTQEHLPPQPSPRLRLAGKIWLPVLVVVALFWAVLLGNSAAKTLWPPEIDFADVFGQEEPVACIQVITPARNPKTGEVKNFPTPCDVPEGWEKIEPGIMNSNY